MHIELHSLGGTLSSIEVTLEGSGGGDVGGGDRSASAPPADTPSPTQQSLLLAALVGAYANHFLARTMALKQARRMVSELIAKVAAL